MDMGKKAYVPVFVLFFLSSVCQSDDRLTQVKPLYPGDTLITEGGDFALGFFSPTSSNNSLYIGIWYHNIPERTVVWVANRHKPITTPSAHLVITNSSELVLSDAKGHTVWTTVNDATAGGAGAVVVLLNSGNFVLRSASGIEVWQSFDHPTDTILPNMRFLWSYRKQAAGQLIAWKGPDDPSNDGKFYYTYSVSDSSQYTRISLDYSGRMRILSWNNNTLSWTVIAENGNGCERYASCGPFGYCDLTGAVPACRCPNGFEFVDGLNFSRGC
ncbi:hypothetical protein PR202_gb14250 [Eleusine coracana subsp. coracana]|uniref:non-specific serine/threonine protein kinase n=1 Tax=Eleusine coracana subsp. coracana TaxID=191504 RepID=A0AAV5EU22_ELECO|nr:hypothetical protein PR202_gb14250 [Eleusine coracana subsp. coracana]